MEKERIDMFVELVNEYCKESVRKGDCGPDDCEYCPIEAARKKVCGEETEEEEDLEDLDEDLL